MIKWQKKKKKSWRRIETLFKKKASLQKKFWFIYREVLSVTWPNFAVVKYNSKISNIYHQKKFWKRFIKAVLTNFAIFTKKHLCWSLFINKNAGLQSWNVIKKRIQQRCFLVNIAKFLRTPVLKNICERLFERFATRANNITSNIGSEEDIFFKDKTTKAF